jgi:heptosyltransferase-1
MTASLKTNNIKILIIRLSSIGDIFHTFTVLCDIKNQYPNACIDWLVDDNFLAIAQLSPLIDNLYSIPIKSWKQESKLGAIIKLIKWQQEFKKKYNNKRYDYIIDMHGLIKTAVLTKFFNGKSYGLNYKSAKEKIWASIFYHHTYYVNNNQVAIKRFRSLVGQILQLNYKSPFQFAINMHPVAIKIDQPYIVLLHGTSKKTKQWSLHNWVDLVIDLLIANAYKIVITYSNSIEFTFTNKLLQQIQESAVNKPEIMIDNLQVIATLPIAELSYLIKHSSLVIGVDTGFTHLANLLHKPVIAIYKITNQNYGGLLTNNHSFNLVCNNSPNEHLFIQGVAKANNMI